GVALLLLVPPIPTAVSTDCLLEPGKDAPLRAEVAGKVSRVLVRQGDAVAPGQVLAILQNPEIQQNALSVAAQLALADSNLRSEQDRLDPSKAARAAEERTRLQKELAVAQRDLEALQIRSPIAGVVTTPELHQKTGEFIAAGEEF